MSHVQPHRLADLAAGRLGARRAAQVRVHLDDCAACRQAWERIRSARAAFVELAGATAPELRWDRIRAQVYWSLGQARTDDAPAPRSAWWPRPAIAGLALAAVATLVTIAPWRSAGPAKLADSAPAPAAPVIAQPTELAAVVTLVEGKVARDRAGEATLTSADAVGGALVRAGDRLLTTDGRIALQFGPASTATVGRQSQLTVTRLDDAVIALAIDGLVDVEVTRRAPEQRFMIVAGERTVEVRGTGFRVEHSGGALVVACDHGRVAVSTATSSVDLAAGQGLRVLAGEPLVAQRIRPLDADELAQLAAARPRPLALWTDPETVLATTAPLAVRVAPEQGVRVDGEVIGAGPLWMRLPAGRHLIEAELGGGDFGPGRWIELDGRQTAPIDLGDGPVATLEGVPSAPARPLASSAAARTARKNQLITLLDRGRLNGCVRALAKQGMAAGTSLELEIGVDAGGAIEFLNIVDTDLPDRVAGCVRDVVGLVRLPDGPRATWRHRVSF